MKNIIETKLFSEHYNKALKEIRDAGEIVIFGAGVYGKVLLNDINDYEIAKVLCFCDNNPDLVGKKFQKVDVYDRKGMLERFPHTMVVITPKIYMNEILRQLLKDGKSMDEMMVVDVEGRW